MKTFKTVSKGWVDVTSSAAKKTIALRQANSNIATFTIKPANADDEITLEELKINVYTGAIGTNSLTGNEIRVKLDNVEQFDYTITGTNHDILYDLNETVPAEGIKVTVDLKADKAWIYTVDVLKVNNKTYTSGSKRFMKQFVPAVARIAKQQDLDGTTKFTLAIDGKAESSYSLSNFCVKYTEGSAQVNDQCKLWEFEDGDTFEVVGGTGVNMIKEITYTVNGADASEANVTVQYSVMPDYFKVEGNDARVYKVKN